MLNLGFIYQEIETHSHASKQMQGEPQEIKVSAEVQALKKSYKNSNINNKQGFKVLYFFKEKYKVNKIIQYNCGIQRKFDAIDWTYSRKHNVFCNKN